MTFSHAIHTGFRKYGDFLGRASRSEFWWWVLFTTLAGAAISAIPLWTLSLPDGTMSSGPTLSGFWSIAVLLPSLAVAVRRLRDAGYGWGHLFWLLLPVAGLVVLVVVCAQPSQQPPVVSVPESARP